MKLIINLCFTYLLVLNSCNRITNKEQIEELQIFGYNSFLLKDSNNHNYSFHYLSDTVKFKYDSTKLDIVFYFEYKKNSLIKFAIGPFGKTKYYNIPHFNPVHFENIINRLLLNDSLDSKYWNPHEMYDGYSYTLHFRTTKKEFEIDYAPCYLPDSLKFLHDYVTKIAQDNRKRIIEKFEYDPITSSRAKKLFIRRPPPLIIPD